MSISLSPANSYPCYVATGGSFRNIQRDGAAVGVCDLSTQLLAVEVPDEFLALKR
jgi:hypothetical protein